MSAQQKRTRAGWSHSTPLKKPDVLLTEQKVSVAGRAQYTLLVSLQPTLSPQFASLVGAGVMLLLMVKVGPFFYELPNVSGTDQISEPRKPGVQIAAWRASPQNCPQRVPTGCPSLSSPFPLK